RRVLFRSVTESTAHSVPADDRRDRTPGGLQSSRPSLLRRTGTSRTAADPGRSVKVSRRCRRARAALPQTHRCRPRHRGDSRAPAMYERLSGCRHRVHARARACEAARPGSRTRGDRGQARRHPQVAVSPRSSRRRRSDGNAYFSTPSTRVRALCWTVRRWSWSRRDSAYIVYTSSVPEGRTANQALSVVTFSPPMGALFPGAEVSTDLTASPPMVFALTWEAARAPSFAFCSRVAGAS